MDDDMPTEDERLKLQKPVERVGLYIMVFLLILLGPCDMSPDHNEIINRLDKIEKIVNQGVQADTRSRAGDL